jgi:asparagine synthase (glutamine-hydrolysing)
MCGIAGIWFKTRQDGAAAFLEPMKKAMFHRGPDGHGSWFSEDYKVSLGHRRLAIIDLSPSGAQPMTFGEDLVISFNGEIYNYIELRGQLLEKGYIFNTDSDTEVLLKAYHLWGKDMLMHLDGMFAFALYDSSRNELFCARDRFGEKPFYYSFHNGHLFFASEMKALWAAGVPKTPNYSMYYQYLVNDLVENPNDQRETFYSGIFKLQPGHCFTYKGGETISQHRYWELNIENRSDLDLCTAADRFMELLTISVNRRLRSDVKVGSSLSGGLDSSTIVGIIAGIQSENHTFSARFPGFKKDEGKYIDLITDTFQTQHHNVTVNEKTLIHELDRLIHHQEEPFQTGSIFAQYCVYREARNQNVIVMLDGQGADELLGGYDKDFKFYLRELVKGAKNSGEFIRKIRENHNYALALSTKEILKMKASGIYDLALTIKNKLKKPHAQGINTEFETTFRSTRSPFHEFNDLKSMLRHELTNQGLEKLLRFADRNSMANSVEVRLPFLYHELVEFVFSLKSDLFLQDGWSKAILRQGVCQLLPEEITYRKDKIGFEAPHKEWTLNKELDELYNESRESLLQERIITSEYQDRWKVLIAGKYLMNT